MTFGHVFPFSSHHYQLRLWLRAGHLDPDEDVRLVVVPPPFMVWTLRKGQLDGFCVGEPWNSLAVAAGAGTILHQGPDIVRDCPEKVLAFRAEWARSHGDDVRALAGAVGDASRWAAAPGNRNSLVTLLTSTAWQDVSPRTIERVVDNPASTSGPALAATGLRLDDDAIKADPARALWLYAQMAAAGQTVYSRVQAEAAAAVYAPALGPPISRPATTPVAFDGPAFSPERYCILPRGIEGGAPKLSDACVAQYMRRRVQYFGKLAPRHSLADAKTGGPGPPREVKTSSIMLGTELASKS